MEAYYALIYVALGAGFFVLTIRYSDILLSRGKIRIVYSEHRTATEKPCLKGVPKSFGVGRPISLDEIAGRAMRAAGLDAGCAGNLRDDLEWYLKGKGRAVRNCFVRSGGALEGLLTYRIYEEAILNGEPAMRDVPLEVRRSMHYLNRNRRGGGPPLQFGIGRTAVIYFPSEDSTARFASSLLVPTAAGASLLLSSMCGLLVMR